jgi:hypothetical protein
MSEAEFGRQYFSVFGVAKDAVANNVLAVCRQEKIDDRVAAKIVAAAQMSVEQTATNTYASMWGTVQKFFRK